MKTLVSFAAILIALHASGQTITVTEVHTPITKVQLDSLSAVLYRYNTDGYFVAPNIPQEKLDTARKYCNVPSDEDVFALLDNSVKQNAVYSLLVCRTGIYVNNNGDSNNPGRYFISYEALRNQQVTGSGFLEVGVGPTSINIAASGFKKKTMVQMLNAIKRAVSN